VSDKLVKMESTFSLVPRSLAEAMEFSKILAQSDLVPKDYRNKPGNVLVAIQMGAEVGLAPMQAVQSIAVINGRPSLWGDGLLALVQGHGDCEDVIETDDGETATCIVKRRGRADTTATFSMADARNAGLAGGNVWKSYPKRMRQMRARGFALRDAFADVLKGLNLAEEQRDIVEARAEVKAPQASTTLPANTQTAPAEPPPPVDAGDFVVQAGKHKGIRVRDLGNERVAWFAENSKDEKLQAACQEYMERMIEAEVPAPTEQSEDPPTLFDQQTGEVQQ
jgi:hypothetical protein